MIDLAKAASALALAAMVYQRQQGYDLRSRSFLIPDGPMVLELIGPDGGAPELFKLAPEQAAELLKGAHAEAGERGFGWVREPLALKPAPKLAALIKRSRELAAAGEGEDESGEG